MFDDLVPQALVHQSLVIGDIVELSVDFGTSLGRILFSQVLLEELLYATLDSQLHIAELFVDLMSEHLAEEEHLMVLRLVSLNGIDYRLGLVNYNRLKTVLLVEIGLQILLHRLSAHIVHVNALVIMFHLLQVNVSDQFSKLLLCVVEFGLLHDEVGAHRRHGGEDVQFCVDSWCAFASHAVGHVFYFIINVEFLQWQ
jgi:hypothetical protein